MKLKSFNDLLAGLLSEIQFIEKKALELYPKMKAKAQSQEIKDVIDEHLSEMRKESIRIDEFLKKMNAQGVQDTSITSLIDSAEKLIRDNEPSPLLDAAIITAIQQIEHAEASAYSSLDAFAEALSLDELQTFLQESSREILKAEDALETLEAKEFFSPMKVF